MTNRSVLMIPRDAVGELPWPDQCAVCGSGETVGTVRMRASVTPLVPRGDEFTARYEVAVPVCREHERAVRTGRRRARTLVLLASVTGGAAGLVAGGLLSGVPAVAGASALTGLLLAQILTARATTPPVDVYAYRDRLEMHLASDEVARALASTSAAELVTPSIR